MVARDGIEPPTPAFSGPRSTTELSGLGMYGKAPAIGYRQERPGVAPTQTPVAPACPIYYDHAYCEQAYCSKPTVKLRREPATQTLPKYSNPRPYRQPAYRQAVPRTRLRYPVAHLATLKE